MALATSGARCSQTRASSDGVGGPHVEARHAQRSAGPAGGRRGHRDRLEVRPVAVRGARWGSVHGLEPVVQVVRRSSGGAGGGHLGRAEGDRAAPAGNGEVRRGAAVVGQVRVAHLERGQAGLDDERGGVRTVLVPGEGDLSRTGAGPGGDGVDPPGAGDGDGALSGCDERADRDGCGQACEKDLPDHGQAPPCRASAGEKCALVIGLVARVAHRSPYGHRASNLRNWETPSEEAEVRVGDVAGSAGHVLRYEPRRAARRAPRPELPWSGRAARASGAAGRRAGSRHRPVARADDGRAAGLPGRSGGPHARARSARPRSSRTAGGIGTVEREVRSM